MTKQKARTATRKRVGSASLRRLSDLKAASRSIGTTPAAHLAWLTRFAAEDSSAWASGTRSVHGDCLLALTGFYTPETLVGGVQLPEPIPPQDVDEVQRELKNALHDLVNGPSGRPVYLRTGEVAVGLVRMSRANEKPAVWGGATRYHSPLGLLHVLRDLILTAGDRLIACQLCKSPFIAVKKQQFCNAACAQKFRNEKKASAQAARRRA